MVERTLAEVVAGDRRTEAGRGGYSAVRALEQLESSGVAR